ncbi:MAG: SUMF1/EgtB/PvdO family nonheme iron enzyme [Polyangiaceae bacterium]
MPDPLIGLFALSLALNDAPDPNASLDPGPSSDCPNDMRLVVATHFDEMQHYCIDPKKDSKDTHCFQYFQGISAMEGTQSQIRVCMDQYEAPNKKGSRPFVMKSYKAAKKWCSERHKRMCTEQEWETACEGPELRPLAYGWAVNKKTCNSDKKWMEVDWDKFKAIDEAAQAESDRLWQGSPSGQYGGCVSSFGVYDMMGNVEEWVTSRKTRKYAGALMGGFWAKPWTGCRGTNDAHETSFVFYETGFRCCADPGALDEKGQPRGAAD